MMVWVLILMIIAGAFGVPVIPILVVGTFATVALAYIFTKHKGLLNLGMGLVLVAGLHYLVPDLLQASVSDDHVPTWISTWSSFLMSDALLVGVCCINMFIVVLRGTFGPLK